MGNRSSSSTTEHSDPLIPSPSLETKTDTKSQEKTSAVAPRAPPHALMSELAKIRGMFDVHVTCDENDIYLFNHFCNLNGIASAYAVGMDGSHKQQLMTSREYQNGTGEEMVLYALELKEKLEKFGVKVLRVKVESLAQNEGVQSFANRSEIEKDPHYYYEFHFKVKISNDADQKKMHDICKDFQASYAINIFSKNRKDPLITLRAKGSYKWATAQRDLLIEKFVEAGLEKLIDGTHNEFTIFDDNLDLDTGMVAPAIVPTVQKKPIKM